MKKKEYLIKKAEDLSLIASDLVPTLKKNEVILVSGPLGVGKTYLAKEIGKALGITQIINSPTFNLVKLYQLNDFSFYHVDCYRLENASSETKNLSLDEFLGKDNNVFFVEWPEFSQNSIRKYSPAIKIEMSFVSPKERKVIIKDER